MKRLTAALRIFQSRVPIANSQFGPTSAQAPPWFRLTSWNARLGGGLWGRDYAWKTNGCNGVSVFLAGDGRTAPGAGAGRKACPTPAHSGCRPYCYLHPGCRPYHYSQASPVGDATPATSPFGVNVGCGRTHGAEEDTGSDKRLTSSVRLLSNSTGRRTRWACCFLAPQQRRQLRHVRRAVPLSCSSFGLGQTRRLRPRVTKRTWLLVPEKRWTRRELSGP